MKNFIFKSPKDFHKIVFNQLDTVLTEQRHQRMDLADIKRLIIRAENNQKLQKQVDDFYPEDTEDIPEVNDDRDHRD